MALLVIGLLLINAGYWLNYLIQMPDFLNGAMKGTGLGLLLGSLFINLSVAANKRSRCEKRSSAQ